AHMGFRFLEKKKVDLILLDLWMPGEDGRAVMQKLKLHELHEKWHQIPIVFLTAEEDPAFEKECFAMGAEDFVTKPIVPEVLAARIGRIIENEDFR
ncbi:response regulator, partial [Eubacterium aggregans]|uniref:response regulator n=1 Tax=Eubacterium aggregans TaxID=81409 RepID=UPI003F2B27E2